ncbi:MBL fold metallo-hydrolase [Carboxylicivirga sp. N1Y90]|uniref:MBL fold metallo-hydrolase n=1 Tax=Carboxylicivirga fragile TaxID=3417571 RepID=UPI003D34313F|nr:MBL fold metallo-hydrolase [Marinilabiliaceae bacterium N1Y90]
MKLYKIETGNFMCDGGALFGVIPKKMWENQYPVNEDNYCNMSLRCLLIDTGDRRILIDTGIGTNQSDKFLSRYFLNGDDNLRDSLKKVGYSFDDITDVLLTHLHFDHCGGCTHFDKNGEVQLSFPNADYWVEKKQWENYLNPNMREGAVYFPENMMPVFESGKLRLIDKEGEWLPNIDIRIFDGHTVGNMVPIINTPHGKIAFVGDHIPIAACIQLLWIPAYDTNPIISIEDKVRFLNEAIEDDITLFFEHDMHIECCNLEQNMKGIKLKDSFTLESWKNTNT